MSDHLGPDSQAGRSLYFENAIWPHLAAVYNFARWMVRNHHDAEDVAQEALVKAFRSASTFRGTDARPWLLAIVRNSAIDFLNRAKASQTDSSSAEPADQAPGPETALIQDRRRAAVRAAIARLPVEFREALLLREMEGLSYKEIALVLKTPMGTVMSRLSRARALLVRELIAAKEANDDLR